MDRRAFAAFLGTSLAIPGVLLAQTGARTYRVATIDEAAESVRVEYWKIFRNRLRQLGLVEGKNVVFDTRFGRGDTDRLPALAAELVSLKPDVIVCAGTPAALAALKATSSIAIVFTGVGDPVGTGVVSNLARPGRNVTGVSTTTAGTGAKTLELLREMSPTATRLAYVSDLSNKSSVATFSLLEKDARAMNAAIRLLDGRKKSELERSFETIKRERIQGVFVGAAGVLMEHRDQIVQFAARERLPFVYGRREYVDAGGLLSYSVDFQFAYLRGADYVHRILTGTRPGDLPVEQSSTTRLVLNLKTARTLGIKIPDSVRLRVDEVIE